MNAELTREEIENIRASRYGVPGGQREALCVMALAHLRSQPKGYVSAWVPVNERLPQPYVVVMLWAVGKGGFVSGEKTWHRGSMDSGGSFSFAGYSSQNWKVTHWMLAASPPAGDKWLRPEKFERETHTAPKMTIKDDGGFLP